MGSQLHFIHKNMQIKHAFLSFYVDKRMMTHTVDICRSHIKILSKSLKRYLPTFLKILIKLF